MAPCLVVCCVFVGVQGMRTLGRGGQGSSRRSLGEDVPAEKPGMQGPEGGSREAAGASLLKKQQGGRRAGVEWGGV